jgi:thiamine-phosphate pyrophosphorylase
MITELPRLMVVTDRAMAESEGCGSLDDALIGAASAGAKLFQIRDKAASPREFAELVEHVLGVLAGFPVVLVINDRADLALAAGAHGVHRPGNGLPYGVLRRLMEYRLVGVSCHGTDEVVAADDDGADYATLSPIFTTQSKPGYGPALTPAWLERACRAVRMPVYALGGITPDNVGECLQAGAHGVAVMGGIMRADDPWAATVAYLQALGLR